MVIRDLIGEFVVFRKEEVSTGTGIHISFVVQKKTDCLVVVMDDGKVESRLTWKNDVEVEVTRRITLVVVL